VPTLDGNGKCALVLSRQLAEGDWQPRDNPLFSRAGEQMFDLSTITPVITVEERDSKVILSFLAAVRRRVIGRDGPSVGPDGGGRIAASSYPVLKRVTDLEPGITILRASRTSPPLKGSPEVAQFAVCSGDVVRCGRVPEAKLVPQPTNRDSMPVRIAHGLGSGSPRPSPRQAADRDLMDPIAPPQCVRASGRLRCSSPWRITVEAVFWSDCSPVALCGHVG
jgi:hypothetical protein